MKKQKTHTTTSYDRRIRRYHEEKQELLKRNPMADPAELQEAIKRLAHKYRI